MQPEDLVSITLPKKPLPFFDFYARHYFWAVLVLRFVTIFFVFAIAVAMYFYPGGNIHDPSQVGYSLTHNFLSDLGGTDSRSGAQNFLSAFFFNMAVFLFASVGVAFCYVPWLFKADKIGFRLSVIGSFFFSFGMIFFAGVGLTPYDLYTDLHIFFAVNAFRLLVPGALMYVFVIYRSPVENRYALITLAYLLAVIGYVIYQMRDGNPLESEIEMVNQAIVQKLIVVVSMLSTYSLSYAFASQLRTIKKTAP